MKKISILILSLLLQACISTNLQEVSKSFEFKKVLTDSSKSYLYRTNVKLYEHDFSGMIVIKPQSRSHRIIFLNEIGMKFFDIEIFEDSFNIHHIFESMNKKMLIKLLINDFRFILMYGINSDIKYFQDKESKSMLLNNKSEREVFYFDQQTQLPQKAYKYSLIRKNTFIFYSDYKANIPGSISLNHKNIKFAMNMTFIK